MATITCAKCGREAVALPRAPLSGRRGEMIHRQICPECWEQWIQQSANIINHYGLHVADPIDRARLYELMAEYLNLADLQRPV